FGSICARTAYFIAPYTCTCETPSTIEMRCAIKVSAYSSICGSDSTSELSAKNRIGLSEGFDLRRLGGFGMPAGSCGSAAEIACRQRGVANHAEQNDADHHQRRGDGTLNEEFGNAATVLLRFLLHQYLKIN